MSTETLDWLLAFTADGYCWTSRLTNARPRGGKGFFLGRPSTRPDALLAVAALAFEDGARDYVAFATRLGVVKKIEVRAFFSVGRKIAIDLREGDELVNAVAATRNDDLVLITYRCKSIRIPSIEVRPMGREAQGVRGITLDEDDWVTQVGRLPGARS